MTRTETYTSKKIPNHTYFRLLDVVACAPEVFAFAAAAFVPFAGLDLEATGEGATG
jgi:hypothetical protein